MIALIISLCSGAIVYAVSVMYAGIGETFSERAGIMNLGVEGVMLMGAVMLVGCAPTNKVNLKRKPPRNPRGFSTLCRNVGHSSS